MGDKKVCVSLTLKQAVGIFKRFMLINEEQYAKVGTRVTAMASGTSLLKPYLQALGHFIGSLTLAKNRPLLSSELDMKHLLLVGFRDNKNRRLIVTFVCRVLKEAHSSVIFRKLTNPWMKGILQIICEIYYYS
jgi:CCR4-NOT transcription complex subunit 1